MVAVKFRTASAGSLASSTEPRAQAKHTLPPKGLVLVDNRVTYRLSGETQRPKQPAGDRRRGERIAAKLSSDAPLAFSHL